MVSHRDNSVHTGSSFFSEESWASPLSTENVHPRICLKDYGSLSRGCPEPFLKVYSFFRITSFEEAQGQSLAIEQGALTSDKPRRIMWSLVSETQYVWNKMRQMKKEIRLEVVLDLSWRLEVQLCHLIESRACPPSPRHVNTWSAQFRFAGNLGLCRNLLSLRSATFHDQRRHVEVHLTRIFAK